MGSRSVCGLACQPLPSTSKLLSKRNVLFLLSLLKGCFMSFSLLKFYAVHPWNISTLRACILSFSGCSLSGRLGDAKKIEFQLSLSNMTM